MTIRVNEKTKKYRGEKKAKESRINIRVSDDLLSAVDELAREYDVSRSEVARLALTGELKHMGAKKTMTVEELDKFLSALSKTDNWLSKYDSYFAHMGTNVNQIARRVNAGRLMTEADRQQLEKVLDGLGAVSRLIEALTKRLWDEV